MIYRISNSIPNKFLIKNVRVAEGIFSNFGAHVLLGSQLESLNDVERLFSCTQFDSREKAQALKEKGGK